ncbi:MAG: polysaccharide deacetylase family protein [Alphaproteobacteria bacterium]
MATWQDFDAEVNRWAEMGRPVTLWWRDDDATRVTPELIRLVELSRETRVPLAVAVVPRDIQPGLQEFLARFPTVSVLQHGYSHANHAGPEEWSEEFGPHRSREERLAELSLGRRRLARFERFIPVLVPPWNRFPDDLVADLPGIGLIGMAAAGVRTSGEPVPGLRRVDIHADIIEWTRGGYLGDAAVLAQVVTHLAERRTGRADIDEPTGLMTHHLYHDEGCWRFIREFALRTRANPAIRWPSIREIFHDPQAEI